MDDFPSIFKKGRKLVSSAVKGTNKTLILRPGNGSASKSWNNSCDGLLSDCRSTSAKPADRWFPSAKDIPGPSMATMAVVNHTEDDNDDKYSPQWPEPSESSPISTPPVNVSTFDSWETSHTTTDDNTFYSDDEPGRIYFLPSTPIPPPPPPESWKKIEPGNVLSKRKGSVAAHLRSLRRDDSLSKRHPRSINQELELLKTLKLIYERLNLWFHLLKKLPRHVFIYSIFRIRTRYVSTLYTHRIHVDDT